MSCSAYAIYGHSSSYVHIDHLSHGLGSYGGGYDDSHDYHVRILRFLPATRGITDTIYCRRRPTTSSATR